MKLLGVRLSPFVRKVLVALDLKGVAYEQEDVFPGSDDPAFRALSPLGKIPVLVDGDLVIPDSSVICEYLEEKYPQPPLLPADPGQRARARFLEEYGDSRLMDGMGVIFFENFAKPRLMGGETDTARVDDVLQNVIPQALDYLESVVPETGLLFEHLCTADISLVTGTLNAAYGGFEVDTERWPRYAAYLQRVVAHPVVAGVREQEALALAALGGPG